MCARSQDSALPLPSFPKGVGSAGRLWHEDRTSQGNSKTTKHVMKCCIKARGGVLALQRPNEYLSFWCLSIVNWQFLFCKL